MVLRARMCAVAGVAIRVSRGISRLKIGLPPSGSRGVREPPDLEGMRILLLVVCVLQSLLIAGLLYQRRARRVAEIGRRRGLARAADASRRSTLSALTGSMAHELSQ